MESDKTGTGYLEAKPEPKPVQQVDHTQSMLLAEKKRIISQMSAGEITREECQHMLELDIQMFSVAIESLRKRKTSEVDFDIYKHDKQVNKLERSVRRNILTHLTVGSRLDLNQGLVLISIVIDLERIGDYTKNIYELAQLHQKPLNTGPWAKETKQLENEILNSFQILTDLLSIRQKIQFLNRQSRAHTKEVKSDDFIGGLMVQDFGFFCPFPWLKF